MTDKASRSLFDMFEFNTRPLVHFPSRVYSIRSELSNFTKPFLLPIHTEPRQTPLTYEQFLHGTLFEVAFLGDELLQGFDVGIRIAQDLGDGFLLGNRWK
jgi:hypothetical protein